jgi:hypothetical protein
MPRFRRRFATFLLVVLVAVAVTAALDACDSRPVYPLPDDEDARVQAEAGAEANADAEADADAEAQADASAEAEADAQVDADGGD